MTQTSTDIIIIGAGIAGLAAGCYAQMNGYRSSIFEMHNLPGGLCTAWQRQGFIFDGCLQYLFGSGQGQPFSRIWEELRITPEQHFVHHDELMQISDPSGRQLIVYGDPDRLKQHLLDLSPADAYLIRSFCGGIRTLTHFDLSLLQQKPKELMTVGDWVHLGQKMLPFVCPMARWGNLSAQEFANQFKDPFLRRAIPQMFGWREIPMVVGMSLLAYMNQQNAGFPIGGSQKFAQTIAQRYLALGGKIHYEVQVERVLIEHHRAIGVRLYNNEEYRADRVISACDGHRTVFGLVDRRYVPHQMRRYYDGHLPVQSQIQISLGVNRDLSNTPHWITYLLDHPVMIAGEPRFEISIKHYCFDPSLAPPGKSVLIAMLTTTYDYWQQIYGRSAYDIAQNQAAHSLIKCLEEFYPGIQANLEFVDVATPLTHERYTGNWQGSNCGWLLTKKTMPILIRGLPKTLPNLRNFYMIGQWVEPGGSVPVVAMSGRNIIQQICHDDRKQFRCSEDIHSESS